MSTPADPVRRVPGEQPWSSQDLAEWSGAITDRVIAGPARTGHEVAAVCALLAAEPRNAADVAAVVSAVLRAAAAHPRAEATANTWRPLIPAWVHRPIVGATVHRLIAAGVLVPTGRWALCDDTTSGNRGKPQPIYRLVLLQG